MREDALEAAQELLARVSDRSRKTHSEFSARSDSVTFTTMLARAESQDAWVTPTLWTGAVPYLGAPSVALVGGYDDIASAILEYAEIGVSQFLFLGWPDLDEMTRFSENVLPRVRGREGAEVAASSPAPSG